MLEYEELFLNVAFNLNLGPYNQGYVFGLAKMSDGAYMSISPTNGLAIEITLPSTLEVVGTGMGLHSSTFQLILSRSLSLTPPTDPSYPTECAYVEPSSGRV
jgi:hypothetical protein